jgi:hypothetical protein
MTSGPIGERKGACGYISVEQEKVWSLVLASNPVLLVKGEGHRPHGQSLVRPVVAESAVPCHQNHFVHPSVIL